ncbi:lysophospholipid acyltransferase family protein [Hymenobacter sp. DH14]|uniref:Lysophospholipid acyltransferase family protein n=1 Tax=Hymenobacter cyanobacteriorum TaxID=2926463 RepID=A0A9X1VDY8_9BACT|nr:lysophospholipid acyltransferase family protein [Hymenobacter cyanobacteriorum]MCI1186377.1 lysophospholipid acyltransferase family protein [Hymenobacter cyanobacteriorum]
MTNWQGRSQATVTGYRIFGFFIRHLGVWAAYFILLFVAGYYFCFSPKSSAPILDLYRRRLHFPALKALRLLYVNYFRFGQTLIDKFAVLAGQQSAFTFAFDGGQHLDAMVALGEGGILLSAHAGNWEAAGQLLSRLNRPVSIVMYDGEEANIKQFLQQSANKKFQVIFVQKDLSHIFKINAALAANELVCIHADRFLPGTKTLSQDFLGAPARFPEGPFLLALKFSAPVTFVYAFKETATHYQLSATPPQRYRTAQHDTVGTIAAAYARTLEAKVRQYPAQWFNYYDFWNATA